ncbi:hypothetical protein KHQ84_gp036 [Rhodococcus phage Finch]|uniref:Uncharacterized protein n=1 Tax=Rhodococcus phage Finch TaxID=2094144 RepID=A0A2P1JXB0_9CAUD|nr:hypothetical protein KHQ84_gp036 [Rhodococcus phage Finch]AVO24976.1 hypothetical protein SEA_FINCH_36 [Rhodococcus phage Finch]
MAAARTTKAKATEAKVEDPKTEDAKVEESATKDTSDETLGKGDNEGRDLDGKSEDAPVETSAGEFQPPKEATPENEGADAIRDADDSTTSAAAQAALDQAEESVPAERLMYQTSQFDTSTGASVLSSLAYPPATAIRAEEVVDAKLANGGVDDNKN